jgi:hypothetical protein
MGCSGDRGGGQSSGTLHSSDVRLFFALAGLDDIEGSRQSVGALRVEMGGTGIACMLARDEVVRLI